MRKGKKVSYGSFMREGETRGKSGEFHERRKETLSKSGKFYERRKEKFSQWSFMREGKRR